MVFEKQAENTCILPISHLFLIVRCKNSSKKHKKWEGDAVLITESRTATLKDIEGKELSRSTGYKCSDLSSLIEGSTLIIGSKEIEVMQVLSADDYKTGKCFITGITTQYSNPVKPKPKIASKPFILKKANPNGPEHFIQKQQCLPVQPRHDPMAPGALVMPYPSHAHQWESNKRGMSVVDVVVDPRLSQPLRAHQRDGVVYLYECVTGMRAFSGQGAILADEMGLGKTLQCITVLWTLIKQGAYGGRPVVKKAIVITPSSLVKNWQQEFRKWLGSEKLQVFAVSSEKRAEEFRHCLSPVMIISYEMFLRCHEKIQDIRFDLVVCDEGHRLKNAGRKTTTAINGLPTRRRIVLTGTPIQNDLQEFFAIVDFCNPGILGTAAAFRKIYEEPIVASRQPNCSAEERELGECRAAELTRLTSLFCLRRTHEVIQRYLPDKEENVVFCRPTAVQLSLYRRVLDSRIVKSCLAGWSMQSEDGSRHLVCIGALKKLCNCPRLLYNDIITKRNDDSNELSLYNDLQDVVAHFHSHETTMDTEESGKLQVLVKMLQNLRERKNERVVLVSNYTKVKFAYFVDGDCIVLGSLCRHWTYSKEYARASIILFSGLMDRLLPTRDCH
jgi:DNA repair and recombination protein RAD54B